MKKLSREYDITSYTMCQVLDNSDIHVIDSPSEGDISYSVLELMTGNGSNRQRRYAD